jgi:hypothetical protein
LAIAEGSHTTAAEITKQGSILQSSISAKKFSGEFLSLYKVKFRLKVTLKINFKIIDTILGFNGSTYVVGNKI